MKVAVYVRVSTDEQHEENQIPPCLAYVKSKGWSEPDVVREKISAWKNPDRASIDRLLDYDKVVVFAVDRLQRNRKAFASLMARFAHAHVELHSLNEPWLNALHDIPEPWGGMIYDNLITIVGWMAEEESKKRSERTRAGLVEAKRKGIRLGRKAAKLNFDLIWQEYEIQGRSMNKAAKILPYGYGTVYDVITNNVRTAEEWASVIDNRNAKRREKKKRV
jgi:putative DNA-invertase from lambdoid prophage Rac